MQFLSRSFHASASGIMQLATKASHRRPHLLRHSSSAPEIADAVHQEGEIASTSDLPRRSTGDPVVITRDAGVPGNDHVPRSIRRGNREGIVGGVVVIPAGIVAIQRDRKNHLAVRCADAAGVPHLHVAYAVGDCGGAVDAGVITSGFCSSLLSEQEAATMVLPIAAASGMSLSGRQSGMCPRSP